MKTALFLLLGSFLLTTCNGQPNPAANSHKTKELAFDSTYKTIHIFVALADNKHQWIAPVPARIGNGQDPRNNLYWGCAYGIKTYFKKSSDWILLKATAPNSILMERVVFQHRSKKYYLVADAYNGKYIKKTIQDFFRSSSGKQKDTLQLKGKTIGIMGNSDLLAYIGHDGLMDFHLDEEFKNTDGKKRNTIILACYSKDYFSPHLEKANVNPLLWTTGLMAPEAYTIHDALTGYINGASKTEIRELAAQAYNRYQKCGLRGARNLLVND
ncbi:MAG: hypothetical protein MRZ79_19625 [Bacteroidia bacterium]|nr:hypothetical protein [Bacteroidia bacterium]